MMDHDADKNAPLDANMDRVLSEFAERESDLVASQHGDFRERMRARLAKAKKSEHKPTPAPVSFARRQSRRWIPYAAAAACLVIAAAFAYFNRTRAAETLATIKYKQGPVVMDRVGMKNEMQISTCGGGEFLANMDGDRVALYVNAETQMTIESRNRVTLQSGEIWLVIRPNSGPFEIKTAKATVSVLGTTFGVVESSSGTVVLVEKGRVRVENAGGSVELPAGSSGAAAAAETAPTMTATNGAATPQWAWKLHANATGSNPEKYYPSTHK